MKTKHIYVPIVLALTALITCNQLFASDNLNPPVSHGKLIYNGWKDGVAPRELY